jgi:hypothetical protein
LNVFRAKLTDVGRRYRKRREWERLFARYPQQLSAGGHNGQSWAAAQQRVGEAGDDLDDMFTVVEDEQRLARLQLLAQVVDEPAGTAHSGRWHPRHRGDGGQHANLVTGRGELEEPHTIGIGDGGVGRHLHRQASLAHSPSTRDCDQPSRVQLLDDAADIVGSSDKRSELQRQVVPIGVGRTQRRGTRRQIGMPQLPDMLRASQVLQTMDAPVGQCHAGRQQPRHGGIGAEDQRPIPGGDGTFERNQPLARFKSEMARWPRSR